MLVTSTGKGNTGTQQPEHQPEHQPEQPEHQPKQEEHQPEQQQCGRFTKTDEQSDVPVATTELPPEGQSVRPLGRPGLTAPEKWSSC
jgi:hypothetical protein